MEDGERRPIMLAYIASFFALFAALLGSPKTGIIPDTNDPSILPNTNDPSVRAVFYVLPNTNDPS